MRQLTLSRPLVPTRQMKLPDTVRTPAKPTTARSAARKRLILALRPIQSLPPCPARSIVRGLELPCGAIAFVSAAQAWFWTVGALAARHAGIRQSNVVRGASGRTRLKIRRPCDPDDIMRALDLLHRRGEIDLAHARVLRRWGDCGVAPDATRLGQEDDAKLWTEALDRLEVLLRAKSIVATVEEEINSVEGDLSLTDITPAL